MLAGMGSILGFVSSTSSSGGGTGGSFAVSVDPTEVDKTGSSRGASRTLTTASVTVTVSGGAGGETYAWARTSGDAAITADTASAAVTTFSATLNAGDYFTATFDCTVTDAAGAVLVTELVTVTITLEFIDIGGTL